MRQRILFPFLGLVLAATLLALWLTRVHRDTDYQYYGDKFADPREAYNFTLTDQNGEPFSLGSLRGKFVLLTFGFTHCPNICPTTLGNLAAVYRALSPAEQARLHVLFISIDPERDSAGVLKDYVPFFDKHFIGLTGTPDKIAATAKAYGVYYEKKPQISAVAANYYTMDHSAYTYLIDPSGKWLALYQYEQLMNSQRMAEDLRHFLAAPNQT